MNKRMASAAYASQFEKLFACPICKSPMNVKELASLVCSKNHSFDFTKQGYVNLTTHQAKNKYSKDLFEARKQVIMEFQFFEPMIHEIANKMQHFIQKPSFRCVDLGSGEGSHLVALSSRLGSDEIVGVGVDLSKEGIFVAAKNYPNKIWTVADLANTPFQDHTFDVILNILSPSNYGEFNRLLKEDGIVIKVIPESNYLKEIREVIFSNTDKQSYSNDDTVERFQERFTLIDQTRVTYTKKLNNEALQLLAKMTPLTWSASATALQPLLEKESLEITVDLTILIGKKY